jgi:hypothetical protein
MKTPPITTTIMPRSIFTSVTGAPEVDVGVGVWFDDVVADETFVDTTDDIGDVWVDVCEVML